MELLSCSCFHHAGVFMWLLLHVCGYHMQYTLCIILCSTTLKLAIVFKVIVLLLTSLYYEREIIVMLYCCCDGTCLVPVHQKVTAPAMNLRLVAPQIQVRGLRKLNHH